MAADKKVIDALEQLSKFVHRARNLQEQWEGLSAQQFTIIAHQESQAYEYDFERVLEDLLTTTRFKPKRWDDFRCDWDLLVEKLTRNAFSEDLGAQIAYYCAELVSATGFLTWLFSESQANVDLKQRWAVDALDDIEVFTSTLGQLISKHFRVQWGFLSMRPSNIWAAGYREALQDFRSSGLSNWRFTPPLIRTALERAFLEPLFYGRNLTVTNKYVPWEELHGGLKGLSFGKHLPQLDKLLHIYRWASVHTHWGRRYSVGTCWFIANYVADLRVDEVLRQWVEDNAQESENLLQKLEIDGYIRRPT